MPTRNFWIAARLAIVFALPMTISAPLMSQRSFAQDDQSLQQSITAIRGVGKQGAGFDRAIPAAERLRRVPVGQLDVLLDALADTNPVAENWMRGVVFDVVRAATNAPLELLTDYAMDASRNPTGRGLAMELIRKESPETARELIAKCLNDPSLPLREMAVEQAIERASRLKEDDPNSAKEVYREALLVARHPRQLTRLVQALNELGDEVTTADAFVMTTEWKSLAPFDNLNGVGFDAAYPPEQQFAATGVVDLAASYDGKHGSIRWRDLGEVGGEGVVDLARAYNKEKGAVGYLVTEFVSNEAKIAEARLGCINANKVWINGKLVMANEVYHSGSMIDQYIGKFQLEKGTNRILLKICQNEQTEPWAQEWEFQFRITDQTGKGLRSGE